MDSSKYILQDRTKEKRRINLNNNLILLIVLAAVFIIFSAFGKDFLNFKNITTMFRNMVVSGILAIGLTPLMVSRGIDISFGSTIGLSSTAIAMLAVAGVNIYVALLIGIIIGTFCGFLNGILIETFKINALIATLGTTSIYLAVALIMTKGDRPISLITDQLMYISFGYFLKLPIPVWIFIFLVLIYHFVLRYSVTGRTIYLIGASPIAAYSCGVKVKRIRIILYTFSGLMIGIASVFSTGFSGSGNAYNGAGLILPTLSAILLGGIGLEGGSGSIWGTVLGVSIISIIFNGLTVIGVPANTIQVLQGILLIIIVSIYTINTRRGRVSY